MVTAKSVFLLLLWAIVTVTATDRDHNVADIPTDTNDESADDLEVDFISSALDSEEMDDESDDDLQLDSIEPELKFEDDSDSRIAQDNSNREEGLMKSWHRRNPWRNPWKRHWRRPWGRPWGRHWRRHWYRRCRHSKLCMNDSNCSATQYCKKKRPCLKYGCCRDRRPSGRLCAFDEQCLGRFCTVFRCGECREDGDCSAGQFCRNRNAPLLVKTCENKTADGQVCNRNAMCASGNCVNFVCCSNCSANSTVIMNLCEDDSNCSTGQYCKYRDFPVIPNNCIAKEPTGAVCTRNQQCSSGFCVRGRCSQCLVTGHCPKDQYCKVRRRFFRCVKKKCRGRCHCNNDCLSGKCFYRRCRPC